MATGINILGGVDIEISKAEHYYINAFITETVKGTGIGSVQIKKPGMVSMDGVRPWPTAVSVSWTATTPVQSVSAW